VVETGVGGAFAKSPNTPSEVVCSSLERRGWWRPLVVSTSAWHAGSIPGHGRLDAFGVKTWFSTLGTPS